MKARQLRLPIGRLSDTPYVVVDTETTGLHADVDAVVEVAALRFESGRVTDRFETLIDCGRSIPAEASEQHHLVYKDVQGSPALAEIEDELTEFVGDDAIVAHNAPFDRAFLECLENKVWVCSQRAARHTWPTLPKYRNQFLRYQLELDAPGIKEASAHRAAGDALVSGHIFHLELKEYEIVHPDAGLDDFIEYVQSPISMTTLRFGRKHKDQPLTDVPDSYFKWMFANVDDLDPDLRAAIETEIERRRTIKVAA